MYYSANTVLITVVRVQIQSSIQHAVSIVQQYPRVPDTKQMLELLAQVHSEPSRESLMQPSGLDDVQHAANWHTVVQYVNSTDASVVHEHMSLVNFQK